MAGEDKQSCKAANESLKEKAAGTGSRYARSEGSIGNVRDWGSAQHRTVEAGPAGGAKQACPKKPANEKIVSLKLAFFWQWRYPAGSDRRFSACPEVPEGAIFDFEEQGKHLLGVAVTVPRVDVDGPFEEVDEFRVQTSTEAGVAFGWPFEGPFGPVAGEHSPEDQANGEDVRAERRFSHGLFGGHIADGAGTTALDGALGDFGDAEVGESDAIA